jgi:hypothetical protein
MLDWLDKISYPVLLVFCVVLGFAPFFPKPHLIEKFTMLKNGELKRPLDIFDLLYHLVPFILLGVKVAKDQWK